MLFDSRQEPYFSISSGHIDPQIVQLGTVAEDYVGPLGNLAASLFAPGQSRDMLLSSMAMTIRIDRGGAVSDALFADSGEKQRIYEASKAIAEYAKQQAVDDIVYLDRSARPIQTGVRLYQKLAYPNQPVTSVHFLSPLMLRAPSDIEQEPLWSASMKSVARRFGEQLEASNSSLLAKKTKPLLVVDGCVHSGETLFYTKKALESNGFHSIYTMTVVDNRDETALTTSDNYAMENTTEAVCRLFGVDFDLTPQNDSIYTTLQRTKSGQTISQRLRAEIRQIVHDGYMADNSVYKSLSL